MSERAPVIRPTGLSTAEQVRLDAAVGEVERHMLDQVQALLERLPDPELQQLVYELAFKPSQVLPKRRSRPQLAIALVTGAVHAAHGGEAPQRDQLVQLAIAAQEHYDMLDDLVDGDVSAGHETEVVLVTQLLMPLMVQILGELGSDATRYWSDRALRMVRSLALEKLEDKSLEAYRASLEAQSWFFGYCTGLGALVEGARGEALRRAERIGRESYCFGQYLLDINQQDRPDNWNLLHFMSRQEAVDWMRSCQDRLDLLLADLPDEAASLIAGYHSLDLAAYA